MEMNNIYVNHEAVARSPVGRMKRTSPKPAGHGAVEFSDDEMSDYENMSVTTDQKNPQPPAEMPPSDPGRTQKQKHILMLYLLVAICFLMWIILLSLTIKNDWKMTEELKTINAAISQRIDQDQKMTEELKTINAAISQRIDQDQKMTEELKRINVALSHRINEVSSTLAKAKLLCQNVWANGDLVSCPAGYKPTGCACGMGCGSWDIRTDSTCHCRCSGIDWTSARCCKIGL